MNPLNFSGNPWRGLTLPLKLESPVASKVYIVEDNALIRDNLVETLTELAGIETVGYSVTEKDACRWLEQHPQEWQLLIVDLFLRKGSGLGVIKTCGSRSGQQRVVMLSNYATADVRLRCLASGADAVFDKSTELDLFFQYCAN